MNNSTDKKSISKLKRKFAINKKTFFALIVLITIFIISLFSIKNNIKDENNVLLRPVETAITETTHLFPEEHFELARLVYQINDGRYLDTKDLKEIKKTRGMTVSSKKKNNEEIIIMFSDWKDPRDANTNAVKLCNSYVAAMQERQLNNIKKAEKWVGAKNNKSEYCGTTVTPGWIKTAITVEK